VFYWDIPYQAGTLKAEGTKSHVSYEIKTSGRPYALRILSDKKVLKGNGEVAHLTIEIVDEEGNVVKLGDNDITCMVTGAGRLLALENSNIQDTSNLRDFHQRAYQGRLLAYVQSTDQSGKITIRVSSPLLQDAVLVFNEE
ncbi:MAG: glycoside hydrolase family 2, partial [Prevotella sp.]|nr:glycoside hydrolase family 2 [Prevotella sp.]